MGKGAKEVMPDKKDDVFWKIYLMIIAAVIAIDGVIIWYYWHL